MDLLTFIVMFTTLIVIHELGHFWAARYFKIDVLEFGIGIPPRLAGVVKDLDGNWRFFWWDNVPPEEQIGSNTVFSINVFPLGGFVRPRGEEDPGVPGGLASASPWQRVAVMLAGPLMNLALGVILFTYMFQVDGVPLMGRVELQRVDEGSPAIAAGLQVGDRIVSLNGEPMSSIDQVRETTLASLDVEMQLEIERDGDILLIPIVPSRERSEAGIGAMGVMLGLERRTVTSILDAFGTAITQTVTYAVDLVRAPFMVMTGQAAPETFRLLGLKGMYDFFQLAMHADRETAQEAADVQATPQPGAAEPPTPLAVISMMTALTISLGTINLFPIPALDGGRIFFTLPELLFKRRVPPAFENAAHAIGFLLLIGLMLYINAMDFINPFVP